MRIGFLERLSRRRIIKRCLARLPRQLVEDYAHRGPYTTAQIEASVARAPSLSAGCLPYALAIFCDPGALDVVMARYHMTERDTHDAVDEARIGAGDALSYTDGSSGHHGATGGDWGSGHHGHSGDGPA